MAYKLHQSRFVITLDGGDAPQGYEWHKYDFAMAYLLFLLRDGKLTDDQDLVFWVNHSSRDGAAKWIGGFAVDEEFSVDFSLLPSEVNSVVITAWSQTMNGESETLLKIRGVKFRVSLVDCGTNAETVHFDLDCMGPCRCCDILKLCRTEDGWDFCSPDIPMGESIREIIAKRQEVSKKLK